MPRLGDGCPVAVQIVGSRNGDSPARAELPHRVEPLKHAGLVPVLAVHDDAWPVIVVTRWLDGVPLTRALDESGWDAKALAMAAICESLDYAHRQGVVHGRLTSARLLVGTDRVPAVLDLETNRLLVDGTGAPADIGDSPVAVPYLAPEQIEGHGPTPATDVYAIGVVLYELLTGTLPFAGDSRRTLDAHLHDAPELPTLRRDDAPEPLQRICLKALEKKPADRYRSMAEMRDDLERYRRGESVAVRPSYYNNLMETPAQGHVTEIDRWHQQALITDSEHVRLRRAYQGLTRSGLQAISESRLVHWRVSLLYLGGWLVLAGAALWLELYYSHVNDVLAPEHWSMGLATSRSGRVLIGVAPTLLTNGLWWYFHRRGSYRFAFAAMVLGLLSLPFAVGVAVHEIADQQGHVLEAVDLWANEAPSPDAAPSPAVDAPPPECPPSGSYLLFPDCLFPNTQLFIALLVAVLWGIYVSRQSWTQTSATIVSLHFLACYLVALDFWGLRYFFVDKISYGGVFLLPATAVLTGGGVRIAQISNRSRQAVPLFATAMVVAILASQAIAVKGPADWGWQHPDVWTGAIEVLLGSAYFTLSRALRARFPIDAAAAYRLLAWLAPVALLGGLAWMDWSWSQDPDLTSMNGHYLGFGKEVSPWAPLLLASSIAVVMVATRVQSYFYISCGLIFLAYAVDYRIGNEEPLSWPWPLAIIAIGLVVVSVMRRINARAQVDEDIDDVGELLIQRSRRAASPSPRRPA